MRREVESKFTWSVPAVPVRYVPPRPVQVLNTAVATVVVKYSTEPPKVTYGAPTVRTFVTIGPPS